jgi:uncharacterized LabA/DUF88 family protein
MTFNTAIFYDIENLLKGYSFSQQMVANLSLKEILEAVRQTEQIGHIAVQRAYANWSDPRLAIMRGEINELGIDPIQVFGFSRDQKKNAADIQLAIDAIDLAHVRPSLEVFVIVSGDGGFASLAKKLHEYGKIVIGCGYQSATNRTFQAVCDNFVWIADPDEEERQGRGEPLSAGGTALEVTDPRNVRLASNIRRAVSLEPDVVFAKAREVLNWYASDPLCRSDLLRTGIYLSVVQEGMRFAIPGFQPIAFGFPKFIEYMQFICAGTPLCIARPPHSQAVLTLRSAVHRGIEVLPDLELRDLHSAESYRSLLATGTPIFRLPPASELQAVAAWIVQYPPEQADLGSMIEETVAGLDGLVSSESAKHALLSLVSAEAFEREPEGVPISEQRLTLREDLRSLPALLGRLWVSAKTKLMTSLGQVEDEILKQVLPNGG